MLSFSFHSLQLQWTMRWGTFGWLFYVESWKPNYPVLLSRREKVSVIRNPGIWRPISVTKTNYFHLLNPQSATSRLPTVSLFIRVFIWLTLFLVLCSIFQGSQLCTPSVKCPKFLPRRRDGDCRQNYLQMTDGGESFAMQSVHLIIFYIIPTYWSL
jgi:hypothetical protein